MPSYLKDFICLKSTCEDHCCYGWDIYVDKRTYTTYRKCKKPKLQQSFQKKIKRNKIDFSDNKYAKIIKNKNDCPFLTEKRLCLIQSVLGESCLPDVCAAFPRHLRSIGKHVEISASMSCPEIARLALRNPNGIDFIESEIDEKDIEKLRFVEQRNTIHSDKFSLELRAFSFQLLKNRGYRLWERLMLLGILLKDASELDKNDRFDEIIPLIEYYAYQMSRGFFTDILENAPSLTYLQMQVLKRLNDEKMKSVSVKAFSECIDECFSGLNYDNTNYAMEEISNNYNESYQKYYKPFMEKYEYLLENYLVNYLFGSDLCFVMRRKIYDSYVMMALHYAMVKMYLIGMSAFHKSALNTDMVIKLIYSFTKTIEPDSKFKDYAFALLEENGCTDLMSMAVLIKN